MEYVVNIFGKYSIHSLPTLVRTANYLVRGTSAQNKIPAIKWLIDSQETRQTLSSNRKGFYGFPRAKYNRDTDIKRADMAQSSLIPQTTHAFPLRFQIPQIYFGRVGEGVRSPTSNYLSFISGFCGKGRRNSDWIRLIAPTSYLSQVCVCVCVCAGKY